MRKPETTEIEDEAPAEQKAPDKAASKRVKPTKVPPSTGGSNWSDFDEGGIPSPGPGSWAFYND
ncbi:MAG: hypothetical protein AAB383_05315 [Patescibacteria group bacterium]